MSYTASRFVHSRIQLNAPNSCFTSLTDRGLRMSRSTSIREGSRNFPCSHTTIPRYLSWRLDSRSRQTLLETYLLSRVYAPAWSGYYHLEWRAQTTPHQSIYRSETISSMKRSHELSLLTSAGASRFQILDPQTILHPQPRCLSSLARTNAKVTVFLSSRLRPIFT
jgi:hypothetical protein